MASESDPKNFFSSKLVQLAITMALIPLLGQLSNQLDMIPYLVENPTLLKFAMGAVALAIAWLRTMTDAPVDSVKNSVKRMVGMNGGKKKPRARS